MKYNYLALFVLLLGISSCNDEEMIRRNPEYVGSGEAALRITMKHGGGAPTRAVGDKVDDGVSLKEEKLISSVAFIVKTETETKDGETMEGSLNYYLSGEDLLSANGLTEDLKLIDPATGDSTYTCQIKIKSAGWGTPKVLVIANYLENGLDIKAMLEGGWDDLTDKLLSLPVVANPRTPLLMFGMIADVSKWTDQGGGTAEETIKMTRLVSRVDIRNNAYNKAVPSDGFVLESARFINPKERSYISDLVTAEKMNRLPAAAAPFPLQANLTEIEPVAGTFVQCLDTLYTYENSNDLATGTTPTRLEINGFYRGSKTSRIIDFKQRDGAGTIGNPIPLVRNTRYVVNINPTHDSLDVDWSITVKPWTESDTINILPPTLAPAIANLAFEGGAAPTGITWNEARGIIDISEADYVDGSGKLTFSAAAPHGTSYRVDFNTNPKHASIGWDTPQGIAADITEGDPIVEYASTTVRRLYTVIIPQQPADSKAALNAYIVIQNFENPSMCDTVLTLRYRPDYNGIAGLKPVLMKSGQFWAPLNAGATQMPVTTTPIPTTGDITAFCGQLFQWGRKHGFAAHKEAVFNFATTWPTEADRLEMEANDSWKDKFIKSNASAPNTQSNWLRINPDGDNPLGAEMVADAWYQRLWNANAVAEATAGADKSTPAKVEATDPCPKGWRVPTQAEWVAIGAGNAGVIKEWDATNKYMTIAGEGSDKLVLPAAGYRNFSSGSSSFQGSYGYYWSSSVPSGSTLASLVLFASAPLNTGTYGRAYGYSVRCVQE